MPKRKSQQKDKGEAPERKVWTRDKMNEEDPGMPRIWEPFIGKTEACFWGLTFDEGQIARRMASNQILKGVGDEVKTGWKLDEEKLSIAYIFLSARGGDTSDFQFNFEERKAPTLLRWPEDVNYLKRNIPAGRIHVLAEMIDRLSVVSLNRLQEHYGFFTSVLQLNSTFVSSLLPSIEEVLNSSSEDEGLMDKAREALETTRLMGHDLRILSDLARTFLRG